MADRKTADAWRATSREWRAAVSQLLCIHAKHLEEDLHKPTPEWWRDDVKNEIRATRAAADALESLEPADEKEMTP